MKKPPPTDRLGKYRSMRSAGRTPEPFGVENEPAPAGKARFVVQKHGARRLHYDFRLEMEGALHSWAVPKGPSFDPAEKRLAVEVEDHPLEYADFEGIIPDGNYGAGPVIVWDRGSWIPVEDPIEGLRKGKLLFDLEGYKLTGRWTLVRTKGGGKQWLLIKKADFAAGRSEPAAESVLSGLTLEELRDGTARDDALRAELERLGAKRRRVRVEDAAPMLAEDRDRPFTKKGWLFEVKYDGFRLRVARENGEARLLYRKGNDATAIYPDVAAAVAALPLGEVILDGEVVVLDAEGRPSFQRLQKRAKLERARDIARAAAELPATVYLFDLLAFEDFDLRDLPLAARKACLEKIAPRLGPLRYAEHFEERGEALFAEVERIGLEGIIAKKADSPYRSGRSPSWLKIRIDKTGDFVVVGYTEPRGGRARIGALHLGIHRDDKLVYAGRAGSGFSDKQLRELRKTLEARVRATPPFSGPGPIGRGHVWVEPELVCEVRFREVTDEGLLRQPVFLRFRDDKSIADCVLAGGGEESASEAAPDLELEGDDGPAETVERRVSFTNLKKVFWPAEGYTKGDLIEFYRAVSPWMLPYLRDRPLVLTRYPDGIAGKSFFQKDAPGFVPGWLRTERMWSEHAEREIDYFICDDVESLAYVANLGTIPIHVWSSRVTSLARPDWCILDLDPKGAPFAHVVRVAKTIRKLCDRLELDAFIKTSGATGLHVLLPLARQCTYDQSRTFAELLARVVVDELPDIATIARALADREGKVYVDYLQNGHGKTIVGPFSVRPVPGATVSTPLRWSEVGAKLDPARFTIRTVIPRLEKIGADPLRPILDREFDFAAALDRLARELG